MTQVNRCLEECLKIGFFWEMTSHVSVIGSLVRQWIPPKEWGLRSASLAIFFLDLGLGEFCTSGRLEPAHGGNRRWAFAGWSVQPKELVRWHKPILINCMHVVMFGQTHMTYTVSEPQPPQPPQPPQGVSTQAFPFLHV